MGTMAGEAGRRAGVLEAPEADQPCVSNMVALDPQDQKAAYEAQLRDAAAAQGDAHHGARVFRAMLRASEALPARRLPTDRPVWVWSDLHLGHDNIIRYTQRPFANVARMNARLYANWEAAVGVDERLVVVGDVAMRAAVCDRTWQRIRAAAGVCKCLVFGNHDLTGSGALRVDGFDEVCSVLCADGDPPLVFTHMPLTQVPAGAVNIHGHTHAEPPGRSPHINVSVEQLDYRPVALDRLRQLAQALVKGRYPPGATTLERLAAIEA